MASVRDAAQKGDEFAMGIVEAVRKRVEVVVEEEMAGVANRVRERLRGEVGLIAGSVLTHYDMTRAGPVITIRVEAEDLQRRA